LQKKPRRTAPQHPLKEDVMKRLFFGLMLLASPALAQVPVPQIPFSGSTRSSCRGHVSRRSDRRRGEFEGERVRPFAGNTSGPAYAAAAAQLLEFAPDGTFVREIGKNLYAWSYGHTVRVDRSDNIWVTDKGRTWS